MSRLSPLLFAAAVIGCGAQPSNAPKGTVKVSTQTATHLATNDGSAPDVCATFTLQPYSLDTSGNQTLAGAPSTLTSVEANQTDTIAGCIAGPIDAAGDNWGYLVTATDFVNCADGGSISELSPNTVTGNYPVNCQAGVDVPLQIVVNVSIAADNSAGYVDISVGVNSSEVQVGCKQADYGDDNLEHFGESYVDASGATHQGLVAFASVVTPQQWDGTVDANPGIDTYYTGTVDPLTTNIIFQTFLATCNQGDEYADAQHAQCVSEQGFSRKQQAAPLFTNATLADVFVAAPGAGFVSAALNGSNSILIYATNPPAQSSDPIIMDATLGTAGLGYNDLLFSGILSATGGHTLTGIYADRSTPGQLLVTATDNSGNPGYYTLSSPWSTLGGFNPLPNQTTMACLGLFASPGGCFTPKPCGLQKYCGGSGTASDPYLICNSAAFEEMGTSGDADSAGNPGGPPPPQAYFQQTQDFTLSSSWIPFEFDGIYDGQNHTVSYTFLQSTVFDGSTGFDTPPSYLGLFMQLNFGASVSNLNIVANVSGMQYIGGLAGIVYDGTAPVNITNVHVSGTIAGFWSVGGLIGDVYGPGGGVYSRISSSASVTAAVGSNGTANDTCNGWARIGSGGGLFGGVEDDGTTLTVNDCASSGQITAYGAVTGGISAYSANLTLNRCISTAVLPIASNEVAFDGPCPGQIGGLIGQDDGNNLDLDSLWASDTVGCTTTGCATSGFTPPDGAGSNDWLMGMLTSTNYAATYPSSWDFVNVWNPPDGTNPATLR